MALNAIVVALSLLLFCSTFIAKTHLVEYTRGFITEKTLSYSRPLAEFMRSGLKAPLAHKFLSAALFSEIEKELTVFDSNQAGYITLLTSKKNLNFGVGKVANFKEKLHNHYQSILEDLIRDLGIFSGSNLVAGLFGMGLLRGARFRRSGKVIAFSFVIFAAVAFSTYGYLEGISFFRILVKSHLGWWYPASIIVMIVGLVLECGLHKEEETENNRGEKLAVRPNLK